MEILPKFTGRTISIPADEHSIIDILLNQFVVDSDGGNKVDQIDLKLALKSLPNKVDVKNV